MVRHRVALPFAALAAVFLLLPAITASELTLNYYEKTCPMMEDVVADVVTIKQISNPTTAAASLRLFFHDCFVGGCDASTLITTNTFNLAERDADDNISLPGDGFDAVVRAKTAVELQCPGVVSCSDILAVATRDLVSMLGGPFYRVLLGRKDALNSTAASVAGRLPTPNMTADQLIAAFDRNGFTVQELVALSGAHTVGFSHCITFASRIYNYGGGGRDAHDPSMHPQFAKALQRACAAYAEDQTTSAFNDVMTPGKFDNMYYRNLLRGLGLLASDSALLADNRTMTYVRLYAANQTAFFDDFARAMEKLSLFGVKTGEMGEIRRRCDAFNDISTPN